MSPLDTLKNGLKALKITIKKRKGDILELMGRKEDISSVDLTWLDGDTNLTDEARLMNKLGNASDYERSYGRLEAKEKVLVEKLKALAQGVVQKASDKRKSGAKSGDQSW